LVEYVIVHELVHLHEPNHTPKFWQRVERAMPDYEQRKAWLAEHGGRVVAAAGEPNSRQSLPQSSQQSWSEVIASIGELATKSGGRACGKVASHRGGRGARTAVTVERHDAQQATARDPDLLPACHFGCRFVWRVFRSVGEPEKFTTQFLPQQRRRTSGSSFGPTPSKFAAPPPASDPDDLYPGRMVTGPLAEFAGATVKDGYVVETGRISLHWLEHQVTTGSRRANGGC
jgi:hypothetical protein